MRFNASKYFQSEPVHLECCISRLLYCVDSFETCISKKSWSSSSPDPKVDTLARLAEQHVDHRIDGADADQAGDEDVPADHLKVNMVTPPLLIIIINHLPPILVERIEHWPLCVLCHVCHHLQIKEKKTIDYYLLLMHFNNRSTWARTTGPALTRSAK